MSKEQEQNGGEVAEGQVDEFVSCKQCGSDPVFKSTFQGSFYICETCGQVGESYPWGHNEDLALADWYRLNAR